METLSVSKGLDRPKINIIFKFSCDVKKFIKEADGHAFLPVDVLEKLNNALNHVKKILGGPMHITESGTMSNGWKGKELPFIDGRIDVVENFTSIYKIVSLSNKWTIINFHYAGGAKKGIIVVDKKSGRMVLTDMEELKQGVGKFLDKFKDLNIGDYDEDRDLDLIDHGTQNGYCNPIPKCKIL